MSPRADKCRIYVEAGKVRTFAMSMDWPGWCRSGRDETSALQTLVDYGSRYARALSGTWLEFHPPSTISDLSIVERLPGNTTTDFGAPTLTLPSDTQPVDSKEFQQMQLLLDAGWKMFDQAVQAAQGKELRKGPRGGGRSLPEIINHVSEVDVVYLTRLGGKMVSDSQNETGWQPATIRQTILTTIDSAVRGELPAREPRGGTYWTLRYFIRRLVWHELDHAWEIEDRIV